MMNVINGKNRPRLSPTENAALRAALHTEACLTSNFELSISTRKKLGLGELEFEKEKK